MLPSPFWKYLFIPAFSLVNAQGYWSCRSLSERSSFPFLVVPFVLSAWHLSADDWSTPPRERGTLAPSRRDEGDVAFKQSHSCHDGNHSELLQMIIQNFFFKPTLGGRKKKTLFNDISEMWEWEFFQNSIEVSQYAVYFCEICEIKCVANVFIHFYPHC